MTIDRQWLLDQGAEYKAPDLEGYKHIGNSNLVHEVDALLAYSTLYPGHKLKSAPFERPGIRWAIYLQDS